MVDTSIEYESDLAPYKPKTDIVINATAFVPENNPVPVFDVGIQIGKYQKVLRIFGPRYWVKEDDEWFLTESEPISYLDIRYEHASGGTYSAGDTVFTSPANLVGMGWYPAEFLAQCDKTQLPTHQIESLDILAEHISQILRPDGFGFFGRTWQGRAEYARDNDRCHHTRRRHRITSITGVVPTRHRRCGHEPEKSVLHLPYRSAGITEYRRNDAAPHSGSSGQITGTHLP